MSIETISGKNARLFILPKCECGLPRPVFCFCSACARLRERRVEVKGVSGFEIKEEFKKNIFAQGIRASGFLKAGGTFKQRLKK